MPLWGPGAPKALSPNPFGGVTRLTNARIAYLVRQAQIEWDGDSLPQMAARWGVTRRRLRQILQSWRTSGVVPRLNPARRPRAPPIPEEVRRFLLAEWQRVHRGPSYLWRASQRHGYSVSHRQVTAFARLQGLSRPNARKQRKRKRGRYERAHSGSLLHGDFHRTSEAHPHCILWLDDASRMILAGGEFDGPLTEHAIATVEKALEVARRWNLPVREVLTDRGTAFFINVRKGQPRVESEFTKFLAERGVRHVVTLPHNPQSNGKVERFWLEYDRHRWRFATLEEFIAFANDLLHGALWELETPREAFQRKLPVEALLGLHLRLVEARA